VLGQRQDVLEQLERQNIDHDDMRHQIEEAKARMIESNNHERRMLAFKVLFSSLEVCIYNRRLLTLQEIALFAKFDKKCHHALRKLANVWERRGLYILSKAMEQWFENALKPSKVYVQNDNLVDRFYHNKLKKAGF
jgi:hypothetical protein